MYTAINLIGKIIADGTGLTKLLGGTINTETVHITTEVNDDEFDRLKKEIQKCNTTVEIDAVVKDQGLDKIEGLSTHLKELYSTGNLDNLNIDDVNKFAINQRYNDIADQAKGYKGVNKAIKEYNEGIKKGTLDTEKFLEAIEKSNPRLAEAMKQYKNGSMNLGNYAVSLAKATIKTVGLQVATTALNMGISYLASLVISGIAKLVDFLITTEKELEEQKQTIISAGEAAEQTIAQIESDLKSHASTVKEVTDRYIELSKGVSNLGKANQGQGTLSSDEYAEFLDISNQLTDIFPSLKTGVLSTGDSLISLNGDAQTITSTLNDLLETERALAAQEVADNLGATWEKYNVNISDSITKYNEYAKKLEDINTIYELLQQSDRGINHKFSYDETQILSSLFEEVGIDGFNGANLYRFESELTDDVVAQIGEFVEEYKSEYNYQLGILSTDIQNQNQDFSKNIISSLYSFQSYRDLSNDTIYGSQLQGIISSVLNNFHYDDLRKEGMSDEELSKFLQTNIIDAIAKIDDDGIKQALIDLYDDTLSYGDFLEAWNKVTDYDELNDSIDFSNWLKLNDFDIVKSAEEASQRLIDAFGDNISQSDKNILTEYVNSLNPEELNIMEKLSLNEDSIKKGARLFISDLDRDIQNELNRIEIEKAQSIDSLTSRASSFTTAQEALNTALSEQASTGTISSETLAKLQENYEGIENALEITTDGIILNTQKLSELTSAERENIETDLADKEEELTEQFNEASLELEAYKSILENTTNTDEDYLKALQELIVEKENDKDATRGQLDELKALQLEYENATSKHNRFIESLSSADAGSMYDDVVSGLEQVQKVWDAGDYGKDEIRNLVDYMSYDDMSTASIEEIMAAYEDKMKMAQMYFTEGSEGSQRFVELLEETEVAGKKLAEQDIDGNWSINIEDLDEAAKAIGVSTEFLEDNLNKLKDKGWDIEFETSNDDLQDLTVTLETIDERIEAIKTRLHNGDMTEGLREELEALESQKLEIQAKIDMDTSEYQKAIDTIISLQERINAGGLSSTAVIEMQKAQQQLAAQNGINLNAVLGVDTDDATDKFNLLKETIESSDIISTVTVDADREKFDSVIDDITNSPYKAYIDLEVKETNVTTTIKNVVKSAANKSSSDNDSDSDTKEYAKGTVGNAFASGYNGLPKREKKALRSEYGQNEMTVYPDGHYEITNTPTLSDLPKGTVIFNEEQTNRILKGSSHNNGTVGNAFNGGTGVTGGGSPIEGNNSSSNSNTSSSNNKSKTKETEKEFEKIFDWIERRIKKLTTKAERWANIIETATSPTKAAKYYKKLQSNYSLLAETYSKAANFYVEKASKFDLSESYKDKVRNGLINLEEITDEKLADAIDTYQDYWDKYQDYLDNYIETQEKLANIPLDKAADKVEKYSDAISLLDKQLDNAIGSKDKNKLVNKQTKNEEKTLKAYEKASKEASNNLKKAGNTLVKANTLKDSGVSSKENKAIKKAVKTGKEVDLTYFTEGSSGYKAAVKYNKMLNANKQATYDLSTAQEEYNSWLVEASKIKFDNIADDYEKKVQMLDYQVSYLDNKISEIETAGKNVNKSYYESQREINNQKLEEYKAEKTALEKSLKNIKEGTDEWYDAKDAIQECENSISDCVEETYNLNNAINELHFNMFNDIAEGIDRIISEQEFLQGLFEHENMTDSETGTFTNAGIAKLGSLSASYYAAKEKANNDAELLRDLQNVKSKGKQSDGTYKLGDWTFNSLDDLQAKIDETYTTWQNDIKETYSLETDIADLMKDKYQAELDLLQELIDAKKEALQSEKDLHDYQQSIQEKTKDISTIQKQIAAYAGDTSQEGLAKLQKLQVELSEKEEDLRETEYDRYISDQEDMLDKLYDEYEELVTKKLDDFMGLVSEGINTANENTANIRSYLSEIASKNGYVEEFESLFEKAFGNIRNSISNNVDNIENDAKENSGTKTEDTPLPEPIYDDKFPSTPKQTGLERIDATSDIVKNYIARNAKKATKKKSEYGAVNQAIYDNKAKAYKGTGKILSGSGLKGLAKELGVKYDNATKKGTLYKKLKSIKFPGFSKGGIVSVDDIEKQVKANGDSGIVSVNNGEGILTPVQTEMFEKFINKGLPDLVSTADMLQPLVTMPKMPEIRTVGNTNNIKATYNFTLENCTNADDIIRQIQQNTKVQKALQSVTTDRLAGAGRLSVNRIR